MKDEWLYTYYSQFKFDKNKNMSSVSRFCREHIVDSFSNVLHGRDARINFICYSLTEILGTSFTNKLYLGDYSNILAKGNSNLIFKCNSVRGYRWYSVWNTSFTNCSNQRGLVKARKDQLYMSGGE